MKLLADSDLSLTLRNAMYDEVLKLRHLRDVKIVHFTDDVVFVVIKKSIEEVEILTTVTADVSKE